MQVTVTAVINIFSTKKVLPQYLKYYTLTIFDQNNLKENRSDIDKLLRPVQSYKNGWDVSLTSVAYIGYKMMSDCEIVHAECQNI